MKRMTNIVFEPKTVTHIGILSDNSIQVTNHSQILRVIFLLAGARGSRTHRPDRRAGANGFEVREAHRDPSAPISEIKLELILFDLVEQI